MRLPLRPLLTALLVLATGSWCSAAKQSADANSDGLPTIERFTASAASQTGFLTIYRKDGKVYARLGREQIGHDFLEHVLPANGLGGYGFQSGDVFQQEARVVEFALADRNIALLWPQTGFIAQPHSPLADAVAESTANSVQALLPIVAQDADGAVVVDLTPLLTDVLGIENRLNDSVQGGTSYRFDENRSYFGPIKTFPRNVIIETEQTFGASQGGTIETVVDSRSVQFRVKYEFTMLPDASAYMPRLGDERVGFWTAPHLSFASPQRLSPLVEQILRWNIQPSDPRKALSPAKRPIVWYLDRSIPLPYRPPIRTAILEWNKAFEQIGISDAIRVEDAPNDSTWDPDDIRYNVLRWVANAKSPFGAEAQLVWDPRTGEIFRAGVLLDANLVRRSSLVYHEYLGGTNSFGVGMMEQAQFGAVALAQLVPGAPIPDAFWQGYLKAVTMHEIGHDLGLTHNFLAYRAYTASNLQDPAFTARYGVTSSVMSYAPLNLWPHGTAQGDYWQTTIGPYDYHAIRWGYERVPGAQSPEEERPALDRLAAQATDPRYAYADDEDVEFASGHAVDPRVAQFLLTDNPIDWCRTQVDLDRRLLLGLDARFPQAGETWEQERTAFNAVLSRSLICANAMTHYIAGATLSRARPGDPGAPAAPFAPLPRELERRAFTFLDRWLLSDTAWSFPSSTLRRLVYTERTPLNGLFYDPPPRHDLPLAQTAATAQNAALGQLFQPALLQRLGDLPYEAGKEPTMSMTDLFSWTQEAVYGDLLQEHWPTTGIRRNLQQSYTHLLAGMLTSPSPGTPYEAQTLARTELTLLTAAVKRELASSRLSPEIRAHLEALRAEATRALHAQTMSAE